MKQKRSTKLFALAGVGVLVLLFVTVAVWYLRRQNIAVLQPRGVVGQQERQLMNYALLLSLVVVVPVFTLLATIAWKYRASNPKAHYAPDWDNSRTLESIWWLVPTLLITILSVITWRSSHSLDPYKPLDSKVKPVTVQVVALDWKWLFIYPAQHVATVNYLELPVGTPVNFAITSDAPMNSFWIPQLGGQMYAMSGMSTELHLEADQIGTYKGLSANISGAGFAGMTFGAHAVSVPEFASWLAQAQKSPAQLSTKTYTTLARASQNNRPTTYGTVAPDLYDTIIMKYMMPATTNAQSSASTMSGMNMQTMDMQ